MRITALGLLTATALGAAASPLLGARPPARIQVTALEFEYRLSRLTVRQGPALIELVNYGEDEHDLALRRLAPGARTYRIPGTRPGRARELELRLAPGRFTLWCTLAGHRSRGSSVNARPESGRASFGRSRL